MRPEGTRFTVSQHSMERIEMNGRWQQYQTLELIAQSTPEPVETQSVIVRSLSRVYRAIAQRRLRHWSFLQEVEHLEHCFEGDRAPSSPSMLSQIGLRLWRWANRPLIDWKALTAWEPHIQQVVDPAGRVWWHVYDPRTGQTLYLETEGEVQSWLEEHLQY